MEVCNKGLNLQVSLSIETTARRGLGGGCLPMLFTGVHLTKFHPICHLLGPNEPNQM